jgi:CheY-like chemotaxis protein
VLFVEDEAALQSSYARYFSSRYEMAFARTGAEAMQQLESFEPEVLILDLRLPDTDGIALLQRIRQKRATLPVVVTTAYVSMEPLMHVLDLGHSASREALRPERARRPHRCSGRVTLATRSARSARSTASPFRWNEGRPSPFSDRMVRAKRPCCG